MVRSEEEREIPPGKTEGRNPINSGGLKNLLSLLKKKVRESSSYRVSTVKDSVDI